MQASSEPMATTSRDALASMNGGEVGAGLMVKGIKRSPSGEPSEIAKRSASPSSDELDDTVTPKQPKMLRSDGNRRTTEEAVETIVLDDSSNESNEVVYLKTRSRTRIWRERPPSRKEMSVEEPPLPNTSNAIPNGIVVTRPSPPPSMPAPAPVVTQPNASHVPPSRPRIPISDMLLAMIVDVFPNIPVDAIRDLVQDMPVENGVDPYRIPEGNLADMVMNHLLVHSAEWLNRNEAAADVSANGHSIDEDESFFENLENENDEDEYESDLPKDEVDELVETTFQEQSAVPNVNAPEAAAGAHPVQLTPAQLNSPKFKRTFKSDLRQIMAILVDCDPSYLVSQLLVYQNSSNRVEAVISQLLEKKSYPRLKDFKEKERKKKELSNLINMELNIEEFLRLYPDPVDHFYESNAEMSANYKRHCQVYLCNKFVYFTGDTIEDVLRKHKYHFTPAYQQLDSAFDERAITARLITHHNNHGYQRRRTMPKMQMTRNYFKYKIENTPRGGNEYEYPPNLDQQFFKELLFIKNENLIRQYLSKKEDERRKKFQTAKANNQLIECSCCCNDELIDDDMGMCSNGHQFCKACIKQYAQTQIGDSKYDFKCWEKDCDQEFPMRIISQVLEPNVFSKMIRNRQNEEIRKADIPNLETCLHCTYAAIIENPDEKVFYCLNPECLKETCRKCNEPNHLPLRCDEVEKQSECDMRTSIENKVNEAMIRECYKCHKRFYKEEGCNMMHCVCGAAMCYVCRAPIKDYSHFTPNGCPQFSDVNELHRIEMEKAYKEGLEKYLAEHPELKDTEMKNDPKKMLEEIIKKAETSKKAREEQEARAREMRLQAQGLGGFGALAQPRQPNPNFDRIGQFRIGPVVQPIPLPMHAGPFHINVGPQGVNIQQFPNGPQIRIEETIRQNLWPPGNNNNNNNNNRQY